MVAPHSSKKQYPKYHGTVTIRVDPQRGRVKRKDLLRTYKTLKSFQPPERQHIPDILEEEHEAEERPVEEFQREEQKPAFLGTISSEVETPIDSVNESRSFTSEDGAPRELPSWGQSKSLRDSVTGLLQSLYSNRHFSTKASSNGKAKNISSAVAPVHLPHVSSLGTRSQVVPKLPEKGKRASLVSQVSLPSSRSKPSPSKRANQQSEPTKKKRLFDFLFKRRSKTHHPEDPLIAELREVIQHRNERGKERNLKYGAIPFRQRLQNRLRPVRSFGDLGKTETLTFVELAQATADCPEYSCLVPLRDGFDEEARGKTDKDDFGWFLLTLLVGGIFLVLVILIGFCFGLFITSPKVGIAIYPEGVSILEPVVLSLTTASTEEATQAPLHTKCQQKHSCPRQIQKRNDLPWIKEVFSVHRQDSNRIDYGKTTKIIPKTPHDEDLVMNSHRRLQEKQTLSIFSIRTAFDVFLALSNSARFPTTVERVTLGLAWLRPLNPSEIGIPIGQCHQQVDTNVRAGEAFWIGTFSMVTREMGKSTPNSFTLSDYFEPITVAEQVNFDQEEVDIKIGIGMTVLPVIHLHLTNGTEFDTNSLAYHHAEGMINLCNERGQLGFILYSKDFYTLRWIIRSFEASTISRPFAVQCIVE